MSAAGIEASTAQTAAILGISAVHLGRLAQAGTVPSPIGRGKWDVASVVTAYITDLKGRESEPLKAEQLAFVKAQRERTEAQRAEIQRKAGVAEGKLIPADEVKAAMTTSFAHVRAKLLALPNRCAPRVAQMSSIAEIEAQLRDVVHEALNELASTKIVSSKG